jgi:hypothetical protein
MAKICIANMNIILTRASWRYATIARKGSCGRFTSTFHWKMVTMMVVSPTLREEGIVSHQKTKEATVCEGYGGGVDNDSQYDWLE